MTSSIRHFALNICILSCGFFCIAGNISASEALHISKDQDSYSLAPYFSILEDTGNDLTIDDIRQPKNTVRFKNKPDNLSLGYSSSTFWLRFKVKNTNATNQTWLIQHNYDNTHLMEVYAQSNNFKPQRAGSVIPVAQREFKQREIAFSTNIPTSNLTTNTDQLIYIKIQSQGTISLDISLKSQDAFLKDSSSNALVVGLFYGILIILVIYNLAFYFALKDMSSLYLSLFMLLCGATYSLFDGYLQLILTPTQLSATPFLISMFTSATVLLLLLHRKAFLILDDETKYISKVHDFLIVSWIIHATLAPFISLVIIHKVTNVLGLLTILYLISTSIVGWYQNKPAAKFAVIGWLSLCVALLLLILVRLKIIPEVFIVDHLLRFSLLVLALLLSIALLLRINKLRIFNEKSRDILMYSEMQRNLALEAGHFGIWRWQLASDAVYWSSRTCEIFGVKENDIPNSFEEYSRYIHPEDLDYLEKTVETSIANHEPYSIQHRIIQPDGTIAWVQSYGKVEFNDEDKLIGTIGTIQDITKQKQIETEKQQTQRLYEDIFSSATEGFVIRDLKGKTIEANAAICAMYKYTKEEYLKLNLTQLSPPGFQEDIKEREAIIKGNKHYFSEAKRLRKDGSIFDVEIHASLISYQGEPHVFSIVHDITERRHTENVIRQIAEGVSSDTGEEFFQQLISQITKLFNTHCAFICLIDEENPEYLNTFIFSVGDKITKNISYPVANSPCEEVLENGIRAYATDVQEKFPLNNSLANMNIKSYVGVPLFDMNGTAFGVIVIMDTKPMANIEHIKEIMKIFAARTSAEFQRVKAQRELKDYQENLEVTVRNRTKELEAVNLELESFSYSVSHDLRSPLRAIDGFSNALMDEYGDKLDEQGHDLLIRVRKNTIRMGKLIDDLLNLSRLGRAKLNISTLDLGQVAKEIMTYHRENEPGRKIEFICSVSDTVTADTEQLRIVLDNLLNNAWKYSSKKERSIIEFGKTIKDGVPAYFVKDNGTGFDMAYSNKLFGAFQRLHGREFDGSGIGLATVQRIIHRHHGEIWAEAELDQGATFFFTLGNT